MFKPPEGFYEVWRLILLIVLVVGALGFFFYHFSIGFWGAY